MKVWRTRECTGIIVACENGISKPPLGAEIKRNPRIGDSPR